MLGGTVCCIDCGKWWFTVAYFLLETSLAFKTDIFQMPVKQCREGIIEGKASILVGCDADILPTVIWCISEQ